MHESDEELRAAVESGRYVRASDPAVSQGAEEVDKLREEAFRQMAAVFRNAIGSRIPAEQCGLSREKVEEVLRKRAEAEKARGNTKILGPTFDYRTSGYLGFDEWLERLVKKWHQAGDSV